MHFTFRELHQKSDFFFRLFSLIKIGNFQSSFFILILHFVLSRREERTIAYLRMSGTEIVKL